MHPDDAQIEAFVMRALDDDVPEDFVRHVSNCDECAAKLQAEAAFELSMGRVARAPRTQPEPPPGRPLEPWVQLVVGLVLFVAVAAFAVAFRFGRWEVRTVPAPVAHTPPAPDIRLPLHLVNGGFEAPAGSGSVPRGWSLSYAAPGLYSARLDREVRHGGKASVRLSSTGANPGGDGALEQRVSARELGGKRVRVTAFVKGKGVEHGKLWASVRAATSLGERAASGDSCTLSGDFGWKPCALVLNVPPWADEIQLGLELDGHGTIWLDDVRVATEHR